MLAEDRASAAPEMAEDRLGYSTVQLAIPAASVGAYLIDLLHMRSLKFSPMSAPTPDDFLKACQGMLLCKTSLSLLHQHATSRQKAYRTWIAPGCRLRGHPLCSLYVRWKAQTFLFRICIVDCHVSTLQELCFLLWKPSSLHNCAKQMPLPEHPLCQSSCK